MSRVNSFGQPIGPDLAGWLPPLFPEPVTIRGRHATLVPLASDHAAALFTAFSAAPDSLWTYTAMEPFRRVEEMADNIENMNRYPDRLPVAILVDGDPLGFASYLRIDPPAGVIEIGSITFSPSLQRTTAATEAIFLMVDHVFDLGYRRCEWKCDDLNEPSRRAADRFGFRYEGTFLRATHYKGRSRDTAWYAITDKEWPEIRRVYEVWLDPGNFDDSGTQMNPLQAGRQ